MKVSGALSLGDAQCLRCNRNFNEKLPLSIDSRVSEAVNKAEGGRRGRLRSMMSDGAKPRGRPDFVASPFLPGDPAAQAKR